jgi:hypothetical protein
LQAQHPDSVWTRRARSRDGSIILHGQQTAREHYAPYTNDGPTAVTIVICERMHQLWLNVGVVIVSGIRASLRSVTGFPNVLSKIHLCICS